MDAFSYQCGVMDAFCEMVSAGVKQLALSHPCGTRQQRDALLPYARQLCGQYGVLCQPEDSLLLTDLFPAAANRDKPLILFFASAQVQARYEALKRRKAELVRAGSYHGEARAALARELGRLLSYSEEAIQRLLEKNEDREPG